MQSPAQIVGRCAFQEAGREAARQYLDARKYFQIIPNKAQVEIS
jgi:hypothetical protein